MNAAYVDTSALARILLGEPGAAEVYAELERWDQHIASRLLRIELRRLSMRRGLLAAADQMLGGLSLVPVSDAILATAETAGPESVATLDAIHLVTAIGLRDAGVLDTLMTFDRQLAAGAEANGLRVLAPG